MDNPFGFLGAHSNTWEGQIDDAITAYMHPYYWSLYNEENGQQLEKEMDPWGDGFVYTSANSAMYSKSQYTTDTLEVLKRWHDTIMNGEW